MNQKSQNGWPYWSASTSVSPNHLVFTEHSDFDTDPTVDLKYILLHQPVEVSFEGRERRFTVINVSATSETDPNTTLAAGMGNLTLKPTAAPQLWNVGWDVEISFDVPLKPSTPPKVGSLFDYLV